jgi:uncharacterized protein YggE
VAGLVLAWAFAGALPAFGNAESPPELAVSGSGRVSAAPDTAEVSVGAVTEAATAAEALEANNAVLLRVMRALKQAQIAEKDVQTEAFEVSPRYKHHPEGRRAPEIDGYVVSNRLRVTVRALERLGSVLDTLVSEGANQVQGVAFSVAEPGALLDEARRRAVADARRKAAVLAEAAGVRLGPVVRIDEQGAGPPVPLMRSRMAMDESAAVPVAGGELDFEASVSMAWRIEP